MEGFSENSVKNALKLFNKLPERFTWKDRDLRYVLMDDQTAQLCGYQSSDISYEGVSDFDLPCKASEFADEFRKTDNLILRSKQEVSGMCFCSYADDEWKLLLGRQSPYFDDEGEVIGLQTITVDVTDCSMMRTAFSLFLSDFKKIGTKKNKLNQVFYLFKNEYDDFGLTDRQSEVLFLIIRGYTAKEIARILNIGFRTVQSHTAALKARMDCGSRADVVSKALEGGLGSVIPKSLVSIPLKPGGVRKR